MAWVALGLVVILVLPAPNEAWVWLTFAFAGSALVGQVAEWLPSHAVRAATRLRVAGLVLLSLTVLALVIVAAL